MFKLRYSQHLWLQPLLHWLTIRNPQVKSRERCWTKCNLNTDSTNKKKIVWPDHTQCKESFNVFKTFTLHTLCAPSSFGNINQESSSGRARGTKSHRMASAWLSGCAHADCVDAIRKKWNLVVVCGSPLDLHLIHCTRCVCVCVVYHGVKFEITKKKCVNQN